MNSPKLRLWTAAALFILSFSLLLVSAFPAPRARLVLPMPVVEFPRPAAITPIKGGF